jgi:hypothetical protein
MATAPGGIRYWGIAAAALVWLASSSGAADAQALSHAKGGGVVACITATASVSINEALDQKAGRSVVRQIAFEGHCTPLPPAIGFRIVKPVQLETSSGSVDAVIGEVKLQDGSRSRFYVMKDDIATSTPYDPNDYADPSPAVPLDFGRTLADGRTP